VRVRVPPPAFIPTVAVLCSLQRDDLGEAPPGRAFEVRKSRRVPSHADLFRGALPLLGTGDERRLT